MGAWINGGLKKRCVSITFEAFNYNSKVRWVEIMHVAILEVQDLVIQHGVNLQKQLKDELSPTRELPKEVWAEMIQVLKADYKNNIPWKLIAKQVTHGDRWPVASELPASCLRFYEELALSCWTMSLSIFPLRMVSFDEHPGWYEINTWYAPMSFPDLLFFHYPALVSMRGELVSKGLISPMVK